MVAGSGSNGVTFFKVGPNGELFVTGSVTCNPGLSSTTYVTQAVPRPSSSLVLAANTGRLGATLYKDGTGDAYVLLSNGSASANFYTVKLKQDNTYEVPENYVGPIHALFASTGSGNFIMITEYRA